MLFSLLRILTYVLGIVGTAMALPIAVAVREGELSSISEALNASKPSVAALA